MSTTTVPPSRTAGHTSTRASGPVRLRRLLAFDATVGGGVAGLALLWQATPLASEWGVAVGTVQLIAGAFLLAGAVNAVAARAVATGAPATAPTLLAIDLDLAGVGGAVGLLTLREPTTLGTVVLLAIAVWTAAMATVKVIGWRAGRA